MLPTKYQKNSVDFKRQYVRKQCGIYDESNEKDDDNYENQDPENVESGNENQANRKDRSKNELTANSEIERIIKLWFSNSFTKSLRVLWGTSGYPHLMCIYKILTVRDRRPGNGKYDLQSTARQTSSSSVSVDIHPIECTMVLNAHGNNSTIEPAETTIDE
ncbi:unnamed protein product [Didymodactylos carnosus]|uniref:Uncharacterized protein n=1 Tax=Didymodactylos carnosus TaxID=1234261 RepID=A0A815FFT8_9BILA|nr:unnamed protein product [Didymodactylos carnosus]CAF4170601.1 unnamed protein product [Didymodactylos carnosus]